jgi:C1A family cysteine protease
MNNQRNFIFWVLIAIAIGIVIGQNYGKSSPNPTLSDAEFIGHITFLNVSDIVHHDYSQSYEFVPTFGVTSGTQLAVKDVFMVNNIDPPPAVDQGMWGSCTAFSMRYAYMAWLDKNSKTVIEPSTSFWYAKSRKLLSSGSLKDNGSTTTATVNVVRTNGTPTTEQYPYYSYTILQNAIPSTFTPPVGGPDPLIAAPIATTGNPTGFKKLFPVKPVARIPAWQTQADAFCAEIDLGRSIMISVLVYSNIYNQSVALTGVVNNPAGYFVGGHAICLSGYDKNRKVFTFYNSWGSYSGYVNNTPGLYSIPFSYAANSAIDRRVGAPVSSDWYSL